MHKVSPILYKHYFTVCLLYLYGSIIRYCTYVYTFPATFNTLGGESNPKIILDFFNNIVMQYTFVKNSSAMCYTWQS